MHTLEEQLVRLAQLGLHLRAQLRVGLAPVAAQLRPHLAKEGEACGSRHERASLYGRPLLAWHERRQQLAAEAEPWRAVSSADDGKLSTSGRSRHHSRVAVKTTRLQGF